MEAAAAERSLDGVGLEGSDEWRSTKERDLSIREMACGSPETGAGRGGEGKQGRQWHSRRRRRALELGNLAARIGCLPDTTLM